MRDNGTRGKQQWRTKQREMSTAVETEYIKCLECGAVGNWKEFIETGVCHNG